ncbi:hypothetical protein BBP40_008689 [Aspergillus hancockii]|nr:hypothetical protein BBP40_008689 [Aspergillus hancockii]
MDLFFYNLIYRLWICTPCKYAVCPRCLEGHLCSHHGTYSTAATAELRQTALTEMLQRPWLDPAREPCVFAPPNSPPVPGLPVSPGLGCPRCNYACRSVESLRNYLLQEHLETRQGRGGRKPKSTGPTRRPIYCQRFSSSAAESTFFKIRLSSQARR